MDLEDQYKKNIYKVPENYFDELPGRIQKRIGKEGVRESVNWKYLLKLSAPAVAAMIVLLVWFNSRPSDPNPQTIGYEKLLDQVDAENLVTYLDMQGITTDEILLNIDSEDLRESLEGYDDGLIPQDEIDDEFIEALIDEYDLGV